MNKYILLLVISLASSTIYAQEIDYNLDGGYIAKGYDVVSYFDHSPQKGNKNFITAYQNAKLKFTNQKNLDLFKSNPEKYFPQYGGWCAYAMGAKGDKLTIDPKTYEIRDGKLFLFYNSWGNNTLNRWLEKNTAELKLKADKNWERTKYKK